MGASGSIIEETILLAESAIVHFLTGGLDMKKLFAMSLAIALLFSLAAWGGGEAKLCSADVLAYSAPADEAEAASQGKLEPVPFEELTVVDNEECVIKITGVDPDNMWGYTLKVYVENKSADKTYMFSVPSAAVNGVESDPFYAEEVAPGKKSNGELSFSDDLAAYGIDTYTDIELSFRVYDSEDWFADAVAEETVHVYPYGEENAQQFVREAQAADMILVDNDDICVIVTGCEEDEFWGYSVNLYLVNKTEKELMFSADDVSVNGFMADPYWAATVTAGKVAFTSMSWFDSTFEENGITAVEEIEMTFRVYDSEDWFSDDLYNEVITLKP